MQKAKGQQRSKLSKRSAIDYRVSVAPKKMEKTTKTSEENKKPIFTQCYCSACQLLQKIITWYKKRIITLFTIE